MRKWRSCKSNKDKEYENCRKKYTETQSSLSEEAKIKLSKENKLNKQLSRENQKTTFSRQNVRTDAER